MSDKGLKIWVLSHKDGCDLFKYDKYYEHIHIGAAINKDTKHNYKDDINDNISNKNYSYSELTGEYWVWKNMPSSEIIGFEHYRRHFELSEKEIKDILCEKDIILPKRLNEGVSIKQHYEYCHSLHDIESIKNIIKELYPDYMESWDNYIEKPGYIYSYNMFITKYDIFQQMMTFTFNILKEFERINSLNSIEDYKKHVLNYSRRISSSERNNNEWIAYQMRICGFIAERLNTLWIRHNIKPQNIEEIDVNVSENLLDINKITPKKKVLILSMSCNQERYINEENAIRQTWGEEILEGKYDNIELLFYRGDSDSTYLEKDVLHLTSNDTLTGSYQKTIDCFKWLVENKEFDYIIRTNTSTYINVDAIQQFLNFDVDENITCGSYLLLNHINNFIPFCPGFYLIFSKKTIELLIKNRLSINSYDDNSFAISLIKEYGKKYLEEYIKEIDYVNFNDINSTYLGNVYCVRVKDEQNELNTANNMKITHERYKNIKTQINPPHGFTKIYTPYGRIPI